MPPDHATGGIDLRYSVTRTTSCSKQIMNVRLAIAQAHQPGFGVLRLDGGYTGEAVQPLHARQVLDLPLFASLALAVLFGVACPALSIKEA